jgi:hypothetical protein
VCRSSMGMARFVRLAAIVLATCGVAALPAAGKPWTRAYIDSLPDSAFAAVETTPDGRKVRHLPHHTRRGRVDLPHVRNALSRLRQVHWTNPDEAAQAHAHLTAHLKESQSHHHQKSSDGGTP